MRLCKRFRVQKNRMPEGSAGFVEEQGSAGLRREICMRTEGPVQGPGEGADMPLSKGELGTGGPREDKGGSSE